MASDADVYRVILSNQIALGFDVVTVKSNLCSLFRVEHEIINRIFAAGPTVIKRDVDGETAMRYMMAIAQVGGICRLEVIPQEAPVLAEWPLEERRNSERRYIVDRRKKIRHWSLQPDQRTSPGRRAADCPA